MVSGKMTNDRRRVASRKRNVASVVAGTVLLFSLATCHSSLLLGQSVASVQANRDNIRYADAFPGADACQKIQNAVNDLPATGGVVVANFQGTQVCAGGFTVGTLPYNGPSAAPTLSYVAGGTLAATTYYVKVTWVDSAGESLASAEASLAVPADNLLVVTSPPSGGVLSDQGWNVYVSTSSGTETLQNTGPSTILQGSTNMAPIPIGTNWTEASTGITTTGVKVSLVGTDNKPVALRLGGETLIVGSNVTVYDSSSITGMPQGTNTFMPNASVIMAKAGANLPEVVLVDGTQDVGEQNQALRYVTIDGNNQAGAQVGLLLNSVGDFLLDGVTTRQAASDGIEVENSCCALMRGVFSIGNKGDGLYVTSTTDLFIQQSQFEDNGSNGVEISGGGIRMVQNDFGGNSGAGILLDSGSGGNWIEDSQIDNQGDGINLGTSNQNTIIGNQFTGTQSAGTADGIYCDGRWNMIEGNIFQFGPSNEYRYSINLDTGASSNTVVGNSLMGLNNVTSGGGINNPNGAANTLSSNWVSNSYQSASTPETYYNNMPLQWLETSGSAWKSLWLDGSNNLNINSPNDINFLSSGWSTPSIEMDSGNDGEMTIGVGQANWVALSSLGGVLSTTKFQLGSSSGPTWTSGSGAPSGSCTNASLYSNTAGASGSTLYACVGGAWSDVK